MAGEDRKVAVGDIIDHLDATPTHGMAPEGVGALVKRCARRPIGKAAFLVTFMWWGNLSREVTRTTR